MTSSAAGCASVSPGKMPVGDRGLLVRRRCYWIDDQINAAMAGEAKSATGHLCENQVVLVASRTGSTKHSEEWTGEPLTSSSRASSAVCTSSFSSTCNRPSECRCGQSTATRARSASLNSPRAPPDDCGRTGRVWCMYGRGAACAEDTRGERDGRQQVGCRQ